jgi:hypothetical protein
VTWLEGADHHLVMANDSDASDEQNWAEGADAIAEFVNSL